MSRVVGVLGASGVGTTLCMSRVVGVLGEMASAV
eukprot:CAMPEP_0204470562 /NCGR_PEP_ID=MMETSP0471-20130131/17128_1 /ASSEMBLY_ACC=CAM_ASM_000602 /TAXON_ID=2969 /ORGANISM="Oxyrrhis marina" /LENGTH=33 /DNA_ID= /DNA_START= /DNA_END= /DNA_ORIENTATION=